MSVRSRSALPLALAMGLVVTALPARAQSAALVPSAVAAPSPAPAEPAPAAAVGPSVNAATVGVHHQVDSNAASPARQAGSAPGVALMIVGGVAILVGLVINNSAGGAIAVGGAVVGLIGLYQYLQ